MQFDPAEPKWFNRDRFVLSAGHASALLYALLHLFGYDLTIDDLKSFRQLGSRTPGHPEYHHTAGVEATTGPLGQGFGNAVGFAIAAGADRGDLRQRRRPLRPLHLRHGRRRRHDGRRRERGASLAGHLQLGKLICLYDDNKISLAAPTSVTFTEDVGKRFEGYGWHVQHIDEAHANDVATIDAAIRKAQGETNKPSIILDPLDDRLRVAESRHVRRSRRAARPRQRHQDEGGSGLAGRAGVPRARRRARVL